MTVKEKKLLDGVLMFQVVAATRNKKAEDRLLALAWDIAMIREGKKPTASKELI
jgi:hypothetical protein